MPWTPEEFRARHNKGLSDAQAGKAAAQANAMIKSGADEGVAIATANKHAHASPAARKHGRIKHPYRRLAKRGGGTFDGEASE